MIETPKNDQQIKYEAEFAISPEDAPSYIGHDTSNCGAPEQQFTIKCRKRQYLSKLLTGSNRNTMVVLEKFPGIQTLSYKLYGLQDIRHYRELFITEKIPEKPSALDIKTALGKQLNLNCFICNLCKSSLNNTSYE